jgi:hypothetical protein
VDAQSGDVRLKESIDNGQVSLLGFMAAPISENLGNRFSEFIEGCLNV